MFDITREPVAIAGLALYTYVLLCYWLTFWRGPFCVTYNRVIGWLLSHTRMQAITLGSTCYVFSPFVQLTTVGIRHERWHYEHQWQRWPLTFIPRYLWLLVRWGPRNHPMENEARRYAGEPER